MSEQIAPKLDPFGESEEDQLQKRIFVATFSMISGLATADGTVSKDEIVLIDRFMKNVLGLDAERRAFAGQVFNEARRANRPFIEHVRSYHELLKSKPKMLEWMIDILLQLSCVDKEFGDVERELIAAACEEFGISDERYRELRRKYLKPSSDSGSSGSQNSGENEREPSRNLRETRSPLAVLRLEPNATDDEIQAQCKKLCADYNPSRIVELGLPEEFVNLAEEKFREIMQAYKTLKAERKF